MRKKSALVSRMSISNQRGWYFMFSVSPYARVSSQTLELHNGSGLLEVEQGHLIFFRPWDFPLTTTMQHFLHCLHVYSIITVFLDILLHLHFVTAQPMRAFPDWDIGFPKLVSVTMKLHFDATFGVYIWNYIHCRIPCSVHIVSLSSKTTFSS
jgi:hypothetical protein